MAADVRTVKSGNAAEIFITAAPAAGGGSEQDAASFFSEIAAILRESRARVFQERVFADEALLPELAEIRRAAYGDLDDGVPPAWLISPPGIHGGLAGVQVHAVAGCGDMEIIDIAGKLYGRVAFVDDRRHIALSGLADPAASDGCAAADQARAMFDLAEFALALAGTDMLAVARTWLWLGNILDWYGDFNRVRTRFYTECGLLDGHPQNRKLPASTGIGTRPAGTSACALDLLAVAGGENPIRYALAGGNQNSPFNYGSAFSRAACAPGIAGQTVFISGTAAIDADGHTRHPGDPDGQIAMTIDNVRAVLRLMSCTDADVVHAIVYCKTPEVEQIFRSGRHPLPWPHLTAIADVCRPDLLFEIEAAAAPGATRQ